MGHIPRIRGYKNCNNETLYLFLAIPREVHINRANRIHSYIFKIRHITIRVKTEETEFLDSSEHINK